MDYTYTIERCSLHTYHRDVTSSGRLFGTKYPVYTLLNYDFPGDQLSVTPNSHLGWTTWDLPLRINGNAGNSALFNCDILHAGIAAKDENARFAI